METNYPPTIGSELRTLRKGAGVTQDEVAAQAGTTRQALRRWENHPALPYLKAERYRAAVDAAVAAKAGRA